MEGDDVESAAEKSPKRMGRTGSAGKVRNPSAKRGRRLPANQIPDLSGPAGQEFAESSALLGIDKGHAALMEDASIEVPQPDTQEDACIYIEPQDDEALEE
jgi:hypothetical protein